MTDLHNAEFGEENIDLTNSVGEQNSDLIVMTGDMLNQGDENTAIVSNLMAELADIAPVYYGYGNHETDWEAEYGTKLHDIFSAAGAVVLDNEIEDVEVKGTTLKIDGYMGYYGFPHMMTKDKDQQGKELQFFHDFQDTKKYRVLF